jgi:hypothetical protein
VERVGGGEPGLVAHQRAVVRGGLVHVRPQLDVRPVLLRGGPQPGHHLAVLPQPPLVLQVEQRRVCMQMHRISIYERGAPDQIDALLHLLDVSCVISGQWQRQGRNDKPGLRVPAPHSAPYTCMKK